MIQGSIEEFGARMKNLAHIYQQGLISTCEMMHLALGIIQQYPQFPMVQVRYLEMLDSFCDTLQAN